MKKRSKLMLVIIITFFVVVALAIFLMLKTGYISSFAATTLPTPSSTAAVAKYCPNRGTIKIELKDDRGYLRGNISVFGNTKDCYADDDNSGNAIKIVPQTVYCTTGTSGSDLGKCELSVPLGNSGFSSYYIRAHKSFSQYAGFYAPIPSSNEIINKNFPTVKAVLWGPEGTASKELVGKTITVSRY